MFFQKLIKKKQHFGYNFNVNSKNINGKYKKILDRKHLFFFVFIFILIKNFSRIFDGQIDFFSIAILFFSLYCLL